MLLYIEHSQASLGSAVQCSARSNCVALDTVVDTELEHDPVGSDVVTLSRLCTMLLAVIV
jgi:hypothetical protein